MRAQLAKQKESPPSRRPVPDGRARPASSRAESLSVLQRALGNQAMLRLFPAASRSRPHSDDRGHASSSSETPSNPHLPSAVETKMASLFRTNFADVTIHPRSTYASGMGALALTRGNEIHFAPGKFRPSSRQGQELLGHELAHVVQQRQGRVSPTALLNRHAINDDSTLEAEAERAGKAAAAGHMVRLNSGERAPGMRPAVVQRSVDPEIDVLLVGHASPLWEHTHGRTREELNLNLSQDRVREVESYFRETFNRAYGSRGTPSYGFERMSVDLGVSAETPAVTTAAVGSRETLREAGGNVRANDPAMRRVDITTRVILHVSGTAPSSVPVEETTVEETRTRRWAVQIVMAGSFGEGAGGGFAMGRFKNRRTGQVATGFFGGAGIAGGPELPIPSASPNPSWTNFTTREPMTFEDFDGRLARLTDLSIGIGVAGYSWAYFQIEGMRESVSVGGFIMNEWGAGGSVLGGAWTFESIPRARTITRRTVETEETPYSFTIPDEFEHTVYFDTGSARIDDANLTQLEYYVETIISHIEAAEAEYAGE